MSAPVLEGSTSAVMEVLKGHSAALDAIDHVSTGCADPDHFYACLRAALLVGTDDRLRGFMRTLQKAVEGGR